MRRLQLISRMLLASLLAIGLAPSAALAGQGRGQGNGRGHEKAADRDWDDRRIIREYYASNALPPGLAKRESLPPGLRKQLRERGTLPPGLQKRLTPVPRPLGGRLPSLPPYYSRYFADRDLLVVDSRTNRIVSIIPDVFP
jgi:hypothetical protein